MNTSLFSYIIAGINSDGMIQIQNNSRPTALLSDYQHDRSCLHPLEHLKSFLVSQTNKRILVDLQNLVTCKITPLGVW